MGQIKLPEIGEGVHEGELVKWLVKMGDMVKVDQPVCEIMTDKATVEIPSTIAGVVTELHGKEGAVVHVGHALVTLTESVSSGASNSQTTQSAPKVHAPSAPMSVSAPTAAPLTMSTQTANTQTVNEHVMAAPSTRRLARELDIELASVPGTGPNGRVMREDIERYKHSGGAIAAGLPSASTSLIGMSGVSSSSTAGFSGENRRMVGAASVGSGADGSTNLQTLEDRIPLKGLRKKISEKMRLSKDHAAHFTYVEEADATELVKLRLIAKDLASKQGIKITFIPFVMKAMVAALRDYPILNSSLDEEKGEIVFKHYFNIGLSVQTDDGLIAPVIKNIDTKSIFQIAKDIQEVVERARNKKLTLDDLSGGTITLTNAGTIGGLFATPVINYPEVAILGLNKIFRKPVARMVDGEEKVVIRDWTYFSISLDHRIVDGAIGAEFMKRFIQYIENPALLALS